MKQFDTITRNVDSYLKGRLEQYKASVNDWSHWDDTFDYENGQNPSFSEVNLTEDTFSNLGISFFILSGESGTLKAHLYFDDETKKMSLFPDHFNMDEVIRISEAASDTSGFIKLGDQFYIVAASEITDSAKENTSNGRLIFGRRIDGEVMDALENMTDSKMTVSLANIGSDRQAGILPFETNEAGAVLKYAGMSREKDRMSMRFYTPVVGDDDDLIQFSTLMPRSFFVEGMDKVGKFILIYSLVMMGLVLVTNFLLGVYLSKPFIRLIHEVKYIDRAKGKMMKLEVHGKNEFTFLRQSINNLLDKIKTEQNIVKEGRERLQATLHSVGDAVITLDSTGNIDFMNPIAEQLTGNRMDEAVGHPLDSIFNTIHSKTRDKVDSPVKRVFELKRIVDFSNDVILISKDGTEISIEETAAPIISESGDVLGIVLVFRDCNTKVMERQHIEYLSFHDHLTGLYNRRFFEEELKRVDTMRNLPLSIAYADVNGLKTINDAFGHDCGDLYIQKVSYVLSHVCRADDIIARTGGDEFVILLPKTSAEDANAILRRIQQETEEQLIMGVPLSLAFGSATKTEEAQNVLEVLKHSEEAMYLAKTYNSSSKRNAVIKSILNTLLIKSPREEAHSKRVSLICADIAAAYGLNSDKVNELRVAGELHDIGKISIDESILNKTDKLTDAEWVQIKGHPETGYRLLGTSSEYFSIAECIRSHHERWDGKGYPTGAKGMDIPWNSRVISLADSYDSMTQGRPYRAACTIEAAASEIMKNAGTQFDPEIAQFFVREVLGLDGSLTEA